MLSVSLLLCAALSAQVPDGSFVVSSFGSNSRPVGGLWLVEPRYPTPAVAVIGLGPDLTGRGGVSEGANCVAIREPGGALIVGEFAPAGTTIDLHEITLAGTVAVVDFLIPVGTVDLGSSGGVNGVTMLPNGDALFCVSGLTVAAPLNGAWVGIARRGGPVSPVPITGLGSGVANGIAASRDGTVGYLLVNRPASPVGDIHSFALPNGGPTTWIATVTGGAGLAIDSTGSLLSTSIAPLGIVSVDPIGGTVVLRGATGPNPNGVDLERATDFAIYVLNGFGSNGLEVGYLDIAGTAVALTNQLTGVGSGIAARHTPRAVAPSSPGTVDYRWRVAPNPGGLPTVGNLAFAVRVDAIGGPGGAGVLLASFGLQTNPILGVLSHLDPATAFWLGPIAPGTTIALSIPPWAPAGLTLYLQTAHPTGPAALAASDALGLTLLR